MTYENDISGLLMQVTDINAERIFKVLVGELLPSQIDELDNILKDCQLRAQRRRFQ